MFLVTHSGSGGTQELWANIADGLIARGFDVTLHALYPHLNSTPAGSGKLAWDYVAVRRPETLRDLIGLLPALVRRLRSRASVVVFSAQPVANVLVPLAASVVRTGTRVVVAHHTPVDSYNRVAGAMDRATGMLHSVAAIVCVSHAVARSLEGRSKRYRDKCIVIKNALPPDVEAILESLNSRVERSASRRRRVVATGRLSEQKNYPVLVRAAALLPDVTFDIIGTGPDLEMLVALARELGVSNRIRFLGHRPRREALTLLAEGDVFVQPSLYEGHSLGLIEAAKLGLPLIVSDVPVQIEGISGPGGERCGIAVDPHDAAGLAGAVAWVLDQPSEYRRWSERARRLGDASSFEALLSAYAELAEAHAPAPGCTITCGDSLIAAEPGKRIHEQ